MTARELARRAEEDVANQALDLLGANLHDSGEYTVWWRADQTDVEGRVTRALLGNGLLERRHYDEASGQLKSLRVGGVKANLLRSGHGDVLSHDYQYDALDSMTRRRDLLLDRTLDYRYDNHDRLAGVTQVTRGSTGTVGANGTETFGLTYNAHGDILQRTASGRAHAYAYGNVSASGTGARTLSGALSGFTPAGGSKVTVRYDANGNLLNSASASAIRWTSYNKPASITARKGGATYRYRYDGARMLYLRESGGQQTFLLGKGYEEDLRGDGRQGERRYFIYAGGGAVARHTVPGAGSADPTTRTHYFHKDALGSVAALTDHLGKLVQRFVYKLGGEQQVLFTAADFAELSRGGVPASFAPLTRRGYTGHGAGAGVQLVDMNGRYYDAQMMRFVSADPFVQSPNIAASHNRYSYAWNNPNKYTDPSGYFFKRLARAWRENWRTIVVIAVAAAITAFAPVLIVGLTNTLAAGIAAFVSTAVSVRLHGGTWNQATKAGFRSAFSGAVTGVVFGAVGTWFSKASITTQAFMHGAATAALAAIKGGNSDDFWAGFASGTVSKFFGDDYERTDTNWQTSQKALKAAVIGGTTSKISGGGFENGAVTAAFAYVANGVADSKADDLARERHYARNAENDRALKEKGLYGRDDITLEELGGNVEKGGLGFTLIKQDKLHTFGEGNENNQKWASDVGKGRKYGRYEIIIRPVAGRDGFFEHVRDPRVMGTLNRGGNAFTHAWLDVIPWIKYGNSADDTTTMAERIHFLIR